jgi:hypothetical protein
MSPYYFSSGRVRPSWLLPSFADGFCPCCRCPCWWWWSSGSTGSSRSPANLADSPSQTVLPSLGLGTNWFVADSPSTLARVLDPLGGRESCLHGPGALIVIAQHRGEITQVAYQLLPWISRVLSLPLRYDSLSIKCWSRWSKTVSNSRKQMFSAYFEYINSIWSLRVYKPIWTKIFKQKSVCVTNLLYGYRFPQFLNDVKILTRLLLTFCRDPSRHCFFQSRRLLTKIFKIEVIGNWKCRCCEIRGEGHKTGGFYARYLPFSSIKPGTRRAGFTGRFQNPSIWIIGTFIKTR